MAEEASREHDERQRAYRPESSTTDYEHNSRGRSESVQAYPSSLLTDAHLKGRGNGPVVSSMLQSMQQSRGNQATRRYVQRSADPSVPQVQREEDDEPSFFSTLLKAGGATHLLAETLEAGEHAAPIFGSAGAGNALSEAAEFSGAAKAAPWLAPFALAGGISEMGEALEGPNDLQHMGNFVAGGMETVSGGVGTAALAGQGMSALGGALGMEGLAGAGSSLAGGAAALGPLAAVAGAGAAGWGAGSWLSENTSAGETSTDTFGLMDKGLTGLAQGLGIMDEGEGKSALLSATELASDHPIAAALTSPLWAPVALAGGAAAGVAGLASGVADLGGRALSGIGDAASSAWDWATDW